MKKIFYILSFLFLSACAKPQSIRISGSAISHNPVFPSPLFVIAGESNAGGVANNGDLTAYELAPRTSLKILNNTNLQFEALDIGTNNLINHPSFSPDNATHGLENGLANCADSGLLGGTPLYLVKCGTGGATIQWWNDSTYTFGFKAWIELQKRMDTAIKQLTVINNGVAPQVYIIWSLGINDANGALDTAVFKTNTKHFFTYIRSKYGASVPIIMTQFNFTTYTLVSQAIAAIAAEIPYTYSIRTPDSRLDSYHWNSGGFKIIASTITRVLCYAGRFL